ncbi:hypothetical protein PCASD_16178 [Puccinia coronata f. sp. avenae]|uniref:Uncharacterized protein n=1 Tax=Puccinia coronata f. sp. avenae TaxID=200324 RepID=A0A2N5UBE2_9BASI|nr:hypothetical protein PCASD_16178 [Puccinia coronata f. sp. avenae]
MEGNLHPDFRTSPPSPLAGLRQDNDFGRELGTPLDHGNTAPDHGRTAPDHGGTAPDHQCTARDQGGTACERAVPRKEPRTDDEFELPDDPIGDFMRETSPQRIPPTEVAVHLRALLHSGETTVEFAQRLFAARDVEKWNIAVIMFIELSCQLHALGHDVPTAAQDVLPGGPAAHVFSNTFKASRIIHPL